MRIQVHARKAKNQKNIEPFKINATINSSIRSFNPWPFSHLLITLAKELANAKVSTDSRKRGRAKGNPGCWSNGNVSTCSASVPPKYEGTAFRNCFHGKCSRTAWIFCSLRSLRRACSRVCWALHAGKDHQWPYSLGSMDCIKICSGRGGLAFRYQTYWDLVRYIEIRSSTLDEHGPTKGKQPAKHNPATLTNDGVHNVIDGICWHGGSGYPLTNVTHRRTTQVWYELLPWPVACLHFQFQEVLLA